LAGAAPGGEEVHHHHLALEIGEAHVLAVHVGHGEVEVGPLGLGVAVLQPGPGGLGPGRDERNGGQPQPQRADSGDDPATIHDGSSVTQANGGGEPTPLPPFLPSSIPPVLFSPVFHSSSNVLRLKWSAPAMPRSTAGSTGGSRRCGWGASAVP